MKYDIPKGKAVTTKRGLVSTPDQVEEKDFGNGAETIKALLKKGALIDPTAKAVKKPKK